MSSTHSSRERRGTACHEDRSRSPASGGTALSYTDSPDSCGYGWEGLPLILKENNRLLGNLFEQSHIHCLPELLEPILHEEPGL